MSAPKLNRKGVYLEPSRTSAIKLFCAKIKCASAPEERRSLNSLTTLVYRAQKERRANVQIQNSKAKSDFTDQNAQVTLVII